MGQMGHLFKKRKAVSFRGTAMLSLTVIVIPLFIAVIIFDSYTVFQEQASLRESRENTLRMYQIQWGGNFGDSGDVSLRVHRHGFQL